MAAAPPLVTLSPAIKTPASGRASVGGRHGPDVTVVVPAYNAARDIGETLESIRAQTYQSIEVLVIDDGSQDETGAIVGKFASMDSRIRLLRQANAGVGAARNAGIAQARGQFIAPIDADDRWAPDKLEKQVACMEAAGSDAGLVYCWSTLIDQDGNLLSYGDTPDLQGRVASALILRNFLGNASVPLFRKSVLDKVGYYLTCAEQRGAQGCEDWDLHLRIAEQSEVRLVPEYLVEYRQTASSMSINTRGMSTSFEVVIQRARQRNADLPPALFRWSTGHFYKYLAKKCYLWRDYGLCLRSLWKSVTADPTLMLSTPFHRMLVKSTARLVLGTHRTPAAQPSGADSTPPTVPPHSPPPARTPRTPTTLFGRIQARRWEQAREGRLEGFRRGVPSDVLHENTGRRATHSESRVLG